MTPRVFISHSRHDKHAADAVCAMLEANGIACWIAPRDIPGGVDWADAINKALHTVRAVVLILSEHSNASDTVIREIGRAIDQHVPVIPFRITEIFPTGSLQFFISSHHWLDAFPLPMENYFDTLLQSIRQQLRKRAGAGPANFQAYISARGPEAHRLFLEQPHGSPDTSIRGTETIDNLRAKLLKTPLQLDKPVHIKVQGTLFPCALLSSGWWEKRHDARMARMKWRDGLQEWLFTGFDQWGPSWDFSWDFDNWEKSRERRHFIAQLGDGDEANSIPVILPQSKAHRLQDVFRSSWGGIEAEISGVLGHRKHFAKYVDPGALELFGGLLDYCLWLDEDNKKHAIAPSASRTGSYSGYLWSCVAPKELLKGRAPCINDVYFVWEHVNFADPDAIAYCQESLRHKEDYIRRQYGELMLVQKSSSLVEGTPALSADSVYRLLLGKAGEEI